MPLRFALACALAVVPLTAHAGDEARLDLRYRPASQVRARDMVVKAPFRPVVANQLTPGAVLAHPLRAPRVLKVELEPTRVTLTYRSSGRLRTVTHAPTDPVLAISEKELRTSLLQDEVLAVERLGRAGVRIRYDTQANPAAGERPEFYPNHARLLILRPPSRPAAARAPAAAER